MNFTSNISELPYILHPITNQKILIDTASTKSFINPNLAMKLYTKNIVNDPFQISTIHGKSTENYSMSNVFPEIFQTNIELKFYLFKFHKHFDWLLGMDNLKKLNAIISLKDHSLILPNYKFRIFYRQTTPNYCNVEDQQIDLSKFRTDHLNIEERDALTKLIYEYSEIFQQDELPLTFTNRIKHHIKTTDEHPIYTKSYRYPEIHRQEVRGQIDKMLSQNIIRPSYSPWSSPIWVVPKKADASGKQKWRIVVDYRKLNDKTISDKYPIPNITQLLDKLGRCQYFTTLDLASGFHQIEMNPEDIPKTAFNTENGHYEYLRMPFGLKNAPATFQRVMEDVLRGLQNNICLVYLDDIIIFSTSLQEHLERLKLVFDRLRDSNFKIQLDKSEFLQKEVSYLGHVVTPDGVKPNPDKINSILNYPIPKNPKQIKGFLGLLGYYRKFIPSFAKITKPMTNCLKKDAKIDINDPTYRNCFEHCKTLLVNEPILQYPDFNQIFHLTTDASNYAIGAVLSQGPIGQDRPIAYASRTLNNHEINYSTIEKELLAIVWATKYFRPYLFGRKFNILTDHKPLQWLFSLKEPNSKMVRWRLKLEEFDYTIIYKKGTQNKVADPLSRIECLVNETESPIVKYINQFHEELETDNQSIIAQAPIDSENDQRMLETDATIHSSKENPIIGIPILEKPLNYFKNQIVLSEVNHPPNEPIINKLHNSFQRITVQISKANFNDESFNFIKEYLAPKVKYYIYFESPVYEKFSTVLQKCFKNSELQLYKCPKILEDIENNDDKLNTINTYHTGKTNHRGIEETYSKLKERYFWPNMQSDIQNFINECDICRLSKYDRHPLKLKYNITPTASKPFEIIHIDSLALDKQKFLTIIDSFSKYAQAYPLLSMQRTEIANKLLTYFGHHGIPKQIIADNGGEFKNDLLQELLKLHKIDIHFISSQHPESNGMVERFHSTVIEHIRILNNRENFKNESIETKVKYAIIAYNNSKHTVTKLTPFEIINGHLDNNDQFNINIEQHLISQYNQQHRDKTKLLYQEISDRIQENKTKTIGKRNETREELPKIPEKIFVKDRQKCRKTKNKYKIERLRRVNRKRKTGKIIPKTAHKTENIHLSNIKRPPKLKDNKIVTGPSSGSESQ